MPAVKFNKEMIIKHRFWVMLGTAVTLSLGGILCLQFVSADETINAVKKAIDAVKLLKGPFANQIGIDALANEANKAKEAESKVWSKAYEAQQDLFKWAKEVEDKYHFYDGLFATDIKLTKGTDPKSWPKDSPTLVHGTIESVGADSFVLKTKSGNMTLFATPGVEKPTLTDEKEKKIVFVDLDTVKAGRYAAVTYQRGHYFGDMLTQGELRTFAGPAPPDTRLGGSYIAQVRPILQQVDPLDDTGKGVVQLKNWLFKSEIPTDGYGLPHEDPGAADQRFITYYKGTWNTAIDFSKGAWIAQEDLWIQREIYRIIGETNKAVSLFEKQPGKDKVQIFKNSYFELHLALLPDNSISFTAKNLLNRRQRLDQSFLVKTSDASGYTPETIPISADPLMPKGDAGKKDSVTKIIPPPKGGAIRKGIYEVRQVLTWETAAIKRIDQVSIGSNAGGDVSHGHRTYLDSLRPFLDADIGAPDDVDGNAQQRPVGPAPAAGKQPFGPGGPKGPALKKNAPGPGRPGNAMGAAGANQQKIPHDFWLTRYVEVSEQSRRIPVAIALIVDQDHVDRVLTHFNNSRLRFLETQVILNQYPGSLQPPALPDAKEDPQRPFGPPGFQGPKGPGVQPGASAGGGSGEMETNMELVIYGIMTLYQRYPPRPTVAAAPGAAPSASAPGAPAEKKNER
jgi:hypothetical protein